MINTKLIRSVKCALKILRLGAGPFESYLVANPEARFSRDEAHLFSSNSSAVSGDRPSEH